jgi:hypothetical protein
MKKLTDILNEIKINNPLAVAARDRASKEQEMDEIKINQPDSNRPPALLEVVKDIYRVGETRYKEDYYTKWNVDNCFFQILVVGDIWKLQKDKDEDGDYYYTCIKGEWSGLDEESNSYYWSYNDETKDFFKILKR